MSSKYSREPISPEGRAEVDLMIEIDRLLKRLETERLEGEERDELASEARQALGRYRRLFGGDEDAEDLLQGYEERLRNASAEAA